jgi:5-methylcytosine-specific restriction endonuclease McrA
MGDAAKALAKGANQAAKQNGGVRDDLPKGDNDSPKNKRAFKALQKEAQGAGSFLATGGKGGLPATEVLGAMRKTKYRCKKCGALGTKKNGGLSIHHISGIVYSKWSDLMGHKTVPENLMAICVTCHNNMHKLAKKLEIDSSQVTPKGDYGTHRDKGDRGKEGLPWRK